MMHTKTSKGTFEFLFLFALLSPVPWFCSIVRGVAVQTRTVSSLTAHRQRSNNSTADDRLPLIHQLNNALSAKESTNSVAWNRGIGLRWGNSLVQFASATNGVTSDMTTDKSVPLVPARTSSALITTANLTSDVKHAAEVFLATQLSWTSSPLLQNRQGRLPTSWKQARRKQRGDTVDFAETPIYSPPKTVNETKYSIVVKEAMAERGPQHESVSYEDVYNSSSNGCGDWWPLNNNCFKAFFNVPDFLVMGGLEPTMPSQAYKTCQSKYGARLATLEEQGAKRLVAEMIAKTNTSHKINFVSVDLRKVQTASRRLKYLYRLMWQWGDLGSPIAYTEWLQTKVNSLECAALDVKSLLFTPAPCMYQEANIKIQGFVCMKPNPTRSTEKLTVPGVTFPRASARPNTFTTRQCPDGSLTQTFLPCRWGEDEMHANADWSPSNLSLFQCLVGNAVHYSLVCDGNDDCVDSSDETMCHPPRLAPLSNFSFVCRNLQAIPIDQRCDGRPDCFDESDEEWCVSCKGGNTYCAGFDCVPWQIVSYIDSCYDRFRAWIRPTPRRVLNHKHNTVEMFLDGQGTSHYRLIKFGCSEGFYRCHDSFCIPSLLLNNGEKDCPRGEDEGIPVYNMTCPDYYRCRKTGSCVHKDYVCDRVYHCPYKDDEMFCHWTCPHGCTCEGQAYTCLKMFDPLQNLHVRYLDLSHSSDVSLVNIHFMEYLFFLNLSSCYLGNVTLTEMFHLQVLDLSFNSLTGLAAVKFYKLPSLAHLDISSNPLGQLLRGAFSIVINAGVLHNLKTVIMTNISLVTIEGKAFSLLTKLGYLDIRDNPIHSLDKDSLFGLTALEELYTDVSKLCCSYFHPSLPQCFAPVDELSSCSDLLAKDFFRVFLWVLSVLTVVGNIGVLIFRQFVKKQNQASPSVILVKNLCAADLLMGIYMVMVGVADAMFSGVYVAQEDDWKNSAACKLAGFLSFVSSEVSALTICLITLDRVLVICFPFTPRVHFSPRVTICACCAVWGTVVVLAAVPLVAGLEFYGQSAICIPLPITRHQFSGQAYAFCMFIVLNFALFICIGLGQLFIYRAVRKASTAAGTERREQDLTVARRLFLVAFTDFCCWFPIGLMGLLAARGTPIPGEVNVWVAIFVLPLNSALNPFLYTLNGLLEQRRKQRMERMMKKMLSSLHSEIPKWQPARVQDLVRICLRSKMVGVDDVNKMLGISVEAKSDAMS